jgi:predicted Zn-dependent protease
MRFSYQTLGNAELARGDLAAAETAYRRAVELSPTAAGLHLTLSWALLARAQPAAALTEMQQETDAGWRSGGLGPGNRHARTPE